MPRIARIVAVDYPHHITQRGNYQQKVFNDDRDRRKYLSLLKEYSEKYDLAVISYCLMPNHVHIIAVPGNRDSMAKTLNIVQMKYSRYMNNIEKQKGHLWQDRYFSCLLDENHLFAAARYVERNPVRAEMVNNPWEWEWSSASGNIGIKERLFRGKKLSDFTGMNEDTWKAFIGDFDDEVHLEGIRKKTMTGRPFADEDIIKKLEMTLIRKLTSMPKGRPKNK